MLAHGESGYRAPEPLLRVRDVAARLAVSEPTVWRLVRVGELEPVRVGHSTRFRREDVEELISRGRERAPSTPSEDEDPTGRPGLVDRKAVRSGRHDTG